MSREAHGMPQISGMTAEHVETLRRMSAAIVVELFGHPGGSGIRQGEPGQLAGSAGPPAAPLGTFQESLRLSVGRLLADIVRLRCTRFQPPRLPLLSPSAPPGGGCSSEDWRIHFSLARDRITCRRHRKWSRRRRT